MDGALEVVDLSFFPDFVDGMRGILGQDSMGTSPGRRTTTTCASLLVAGLFMDSQSLIDDDALLDQEMVEARRLLQRASRQCWSLDAAAGFGECRKP
jgi:hypothetical protein